MIRKRNRAVFTGAPFPPRRSLDPRRTDAEEYDDRVASILQVN